MIFANIIRILGRNSRGDDLKIEGTDVSFLSIACEALNQDANFNFNLGVCLSSTEEFVCENTGSFFINECAVTLNNSFSSCTCQNWSVQKRK